MQLGSGPLFALFPGVEVGKGCVPESHLCLVLIRGQIQDCFFAQRAGASPAEFYENLPEDEPWGSSP